MRLLCLRAIMFAKSYVGARFVDPRTATGRPCNWQICSFVCLFALVLVISSCTMNGPGFYDEEAAVDSIGSDSEELPEHLNGHTEYLAELNEPLTELPDLLAELTGPFKAFLEIMARREPVSHTEIGDGGYIYRLESGSFCVSDAVGVELWRSDISWWVDDFRLGDVDGDGVEDFVFSLWKSYRFGQAHPSRMKNDDETVRNHLFVYTILSGRAKAVWGSSDLPNPIYSFELDPSGSVTPVSSGMLLITYEGEYRDDFAQTTPVKRVYAWQKWGFAPLTP